MGDRVSTQASARVKLLGGFQLFTAGDAPIRLTSRRARSLLAVVCLEGEAGVPRDRLCGLLWSDRAEEQARASLRQCLFELKAALGDLADQILDVGRDRIAVRPGRLETDVAEIRRALTGAEPDQLAALPQRLAAGGLLDGLEAPGLFQDWIEQTRGAFEAGLAADLAACLDRLAAEGRWDELRRLADAGLRRDPLQEALAAAAIRAERATGQEAAAQRRFQATKAALARELGVAPSGILLQALNEPPEAAVPIAAPRPPAPAPHADEPVLAVLAFDNLSGDPALDYFSDGVSDEIQQTVAQGSDLKVIARSSSFQFRGADKAVRKVAAELRVTHLLDGSVRHSGTRVRISAQLVQCAGETTLWANRFDGDLADVFGLQDRIAAEVAQALKIAFAAPQPVRTLDPEAYEIYLRARGMISAAGQFFDETGAATLPLLEQVVTLEPNYAPAWELLAQARAQTLRSGRHAGSYESGRAGVVGAAETALRLDPRRGGAYGALARLEPWGAYGAREVLLQKALAASPNDAGALTEMSTFCWGVGRFREALALAEKACELNPLMPSARLQVAQMLTYVGDYEASIRMHEEIYRRWPRNFEILLSLLSFSCSLDFWEVYRAYIGETEHFSGRQAAFLRESRRYTDALESGDPALARDLVERYAAMLDSSRILPLNYIEAISALGLPDRAYELAERASFDHMFDPDGPLPSGAFPGTVLGRWSALNKAPRFIDLCDRLGLCAYWTATRRWPDCVDWTPYDFKAEVGRRAANPRAVSYADTP
jgi:TolB-like protein/DNA-binding SARP family transcriptional activator